jgi:small subunit ribosomal protein S17
MSRRILQGIVVSDKSDKTISVKVENRVMHPIYKKYVKVHKKYAAHDEANSYKVGDIVKIIESRPISKTKKWVVDSRVKHGG